MQTALVASAPEWSHPANVMPHAGFGAESSSTSVKSDGLDEARKKDPVLNSFSCPSGVPPHVDVSKFQNATSEAAFPAVMPQWFAVMKNGFWSWAVLFTMKPVQNVEPPVEMTAIAGISLRQRSPCGQTTSTLQDPESGVIGSRNPR